MVQFNFFRREVNCKIVYWGIPFSGKTTNINYIHQHAPSDDRGEINSLATEQDRTLFFDFEPRDLENVAGMKTRVRLFTVPGQPFYASTLKTVLQGVDGIIFVVDSSRDKLQQNIDSWKQLEEFLAEYGINIRNIPVVIQWNKRDLPDIVEIAELEKLLNSLKLSSFEAIAIEGEGVFPTLEECVRLVLKSVSNKVKDSNKTTIASDSKRRSRRSKATPQATPGAPAPLAGKARYKKKPVFKKFDKFVVEKDKKEKEKVAPPAQIPKPETKTPPVDTPQPLITTQEQADISISTEIETKEERAQELSTKKRKKVVEDLPWFERILSEDAGRPGAIERFVAQSVTIMKAIQWTIGLHFIVIANLLDSLLKMITGYIDGIFQAWKTFRTIQRRLEQNKMGTKARIDLLSKDFKRTRFFLARLFRFSGFDWQQHPLPQITNWSQPSFPLKLAIESRHYLDEAKRDLSFLTSKQIEQTAKKSISDFLLSFIPNPLEWFASIKDVFIIALFLRYQRSEIEKMYADFLISYHNILQILNNNEEIALEWEQYEKELLERVTIKYITTDKDLETCIDECKKKLQRLIQVLCCPNRVLHPKNWSISDLETEIQKNKVNPLWQIELQKRQTNLSWRKIKLRTKCNRLYMSI